MFDDIGKKIKGLSNVLFWVGTVASTILGIAVMGFLSSRLRGSEQGIAIFVGILLIAVAIFISWISSILLYGYGELIDSNQRILHEMGTLGKKVEKLEHVGGQEMKTSGTTGKPSTSKLAVQNDSELLDDVEMPNLF